MIPASAPAPSRGLCEHLPTCSELCAETGRKRRAVYRFELQKSQRRSSLRAHVSNAKVACVWKQSLCCTCALAHAVGNLGMDPMKNKRVIAMGGASEAQILKEM